MINKSILNICFFFFTYIFSNAQTDSIIVGKCYDYEFGDLVDSTISVDTFDVSTGLLRAEVSGDKMTRYSFNQYSLIDTSIYFQPLTDSVMRTTYQYTSFQKDSIILIENYVSSNWMNNQQTLYGYDTLQRLTSKTTETWDTNTWQTYSTEYYSYVGNNLDNVLTIVSIFSTPDSTLQVYTYDSLGNFNVSFFHWGLGAWDTLVNYQSYNAQGQVLSNYYFWANWNYYYDSLGRLVVSDGSSPFQGGALSGTYYFYACGGWLNSTEYYYGTDQISRGTICHYYYLGSSLLYVDLEPNHTICSGGTVHFNDSLIIGTAPVSYSWTPSIGLSSDTVLNPDASPLTSTTYYLTATDSLGNIFSGCVTVNVNPVPTISLIADTTFVCFGDTIHLTASSDISSGNTYTWSRNGLVYQNNFDSTSSVIQGGNYSVRINTTAGCNNNSDTISLFVDNSAQTSLSVNSNICFGDTARLAANPLNAPFKNYQWVMDSLPLTGATDSVLFTTTAGTYYLMVTCDTSSCVFATTPVHIQFPIQPVPDIVPTTDTFVCDGTGVLVTTTRDSNYTYAYYMNGTQHIWYPSDPDTFIFTISQPTTLYIRASNQGCSASTDTILIDVHPLIHFDIFSNPPPPNCEGDSIVLSTSIPSSIGYQWSNGTNDSIAIVDSSGYYYVYITDSNGCFASSSIMLSLNPSPAQPTIFQNGNSIYSSPEATMQWYLNGQPIPGATNNSYIPTVNGDYTYEVTNSSGCSSMSSPYLFSTVDINSFPINDGIILNPQLAESYFEVYCPTDAIIRSCSFELYSVSGKKILCRKLLIGNTKIERSGIEDGMYFWRVVGTENESDILKSGKIIFVTEQVNR